MGEKGVLPCGGASGAVRPMGVEGGGGTNGRTQLAAMSWGGRDERLELARPAGEDNPCAAPG
eukprot:scaffold1736_cov143-Isochrysis_galbana.AAC.2